MFNNKFYFILIVLFFIFPQSNAQEKKSYKITTIAFYNLENLFDPFDDPEKLDELSPIMEMDESLRVEAYHGKLKNLARVISEIGEYKTHQSPTLIGVSELENRKVLEDLINEPSLRAKNYGIIHYESPDVRGIDVALLYRKGVFQPISTSTHTLYLYDQNNAKKRIYTRDQLLVSGLLDGDTLHLIINHWPSRRGGEAGSRPKRQKAAALNKHLIDSLQAINPYAKIITMGDMNDGPYNSSIKKVLGAKAEKEEVGLKGLYNPMENMLSKQGIGSAAYRDNWDLFDQIILSAPFLKDDYSSYRFYKAGIFNPTYLTNPHGKYKGYPFRSFSNGAFSGGYSDHFPVYVYLIKEVK